MSSKPPPSGGKRLPRITNPAALRQAALRQIPHRALMRGVLVLPVIPGLVDFYAERLSKLFSVLGRQTGASQTAQLRKMIEQHVGRGYRESPYSRVVVSYQTDPRGIAINYKVSLESHSLRDQYARLFEKAGRRLLPEEPEPFVLDVATDLQLKLASGARPLEILDLGAGLGRNTFELLRRGHHVDAVELVPAFVEELKKGAESSGLTLGVIEGDGVSRLTPLPQGHYDLVLLCDVVTSHIRNVAHLGRLFERAAEVLRPGGVLLFNAFVAEPGCKLDELTRQVAEVFWSVLFLREEISGAADVAKLSQVLDAPAPRTGVLPALFEWVSGTLAEWSELRHVFPLPSGAKAGELRWLQFRRGE